MTDVDQLYQATIVDHDRAPRHWGRLADATHRATLDNPLCGDVVSVELQLIDGAIRDLRFECRGCALCRAAASIMASQVRALTPQACATLTAAFEQFVCGEPEAAVPAALGELVAFSGVRRFRARRSCATLPFRALIQALGLGR
jgi:nitrogen fixation protein NifU and related proteins